MTDADLIRAEIERCFDDPGHFVHTYVQIESGEHRDWVNFNLWDSQRSTLNTIHDSKLSVILKARQLGLTWLVLAYGLWHLLFRPNSLILLFSRRDDEAVELLKRRFVGMYHHLPAWLQSKEVLVSNDHEFAIANNSRVKAFPTTAGDSYTANLAIVDEADLVPQLDDLLGSVKPTIDAPGNKLVLLSRVDKGKPQSPFKRIYSAAKQGQNAWAPVFLPWCARPDRDLAWYEEQRRDSMSRTGALDNLHEQYPSTDAEALAPRSLDKRIPPAWLAKCYHELPPVDSPLYLPGLRVFALADENRRYVIGADPAGGNPTSDDSVAIVLEVDSGEEVATLAGKIEPTIFGGYIAELSRMYGGAPALVERNFQGDAVLRVLRDEGVRCLLGIDGKKAGWYTNEPSKHRMYNELVDVVREGNCDIHNLETFQQLASVEGATLSAPAGEHDDYAVAYALATVARGKSAAREVWVPPSIPLGRNRASFGFEPQQQEEPGLPPAPNKMPKRRGRRLFRGGFRG